MGDQNRHNRLIAGIRNCKERAGEVEQPVLLLTSKVRDCNADEEREGRHQHGVMNTKEVHHRTSDKGEYHFNEADVSSNQADDGTIVNLSVDH